MKKILLLFLLISTNIFAQQFDKEWKKVIGHENVGKIKSANKIVDRIYKKAAAKKDEVQMIKCFFYTSKYLHILDENAKTKTFANLKKDIDRVSIPSKALLNLIYAKCLIHYRDYGDNKIMVDSVAVGDYETTAVDTTSSASDTLAVANTQDSIEVDFDSDDEITELYKKTLQNTSILKNTPLSYYETIFQFQEDSNFKKQSLFDYLLDENIAFYTNKIERWEISEVDFLPYNDQFYGSSESFTKLNLDFVHEKNIKKTLELYQQKEINDPSLENQFERAKFSKEFLFQTDEIFDNYLASLEKLTKEKSLIQKIKVEQVEILTKKASKETYPENNIKALALIDEIVKINEKSYAATTALNQKRDILSKVLSVEFENYTYPNENTRAFIRYQNIDRFKISFYKTDLQKVKEFKKDWGASQDSIADLIINKQTPAASQKYDLINKKDYFDYTTEVVLPQLAIGNYLVHIESDGNIEDQKAFVNEMINVSNFMVLSSKKNDIYNYQILDRKTGKPQENVSVNYNESITKTDAKGITSFLKEDKDFDDKPIEVFRDGDSLLVYRNYVQNTIEYNSVNSKTDAKIEFYLDRAIYRPGQTVFYKGIAIQKNKNKSSVVAGIPFKIMVKDVNYQNVKEFEVMTNEFGSFSGEFTLPKNGLTGDFSIVAQKPENYAENSAAENFWNTVNFQSPRTYFKVEEYKRPKFEVVFEPKKESFKLNEQAKVKGSAKAFAGSSISDAVVKYTITRYTTYLREYYDRESETLAMGETKTDASGKFSIDFTAIPSKNSKKEQLPVFNYQINATVTDINGETHSAETTLKVGNHNLILNADVPKKIETKDKNEITLSSTNLNGEFLAAKGEVKLYFVSPLPNKFKQRIFEKPEIKGISNEEFEKLFPYEINKNQDEEKTAEVLVFSKKVDTQKDKKLVLDFISNYKSGYYKMVFSAKDSFNNPIETNSFFQIKQSAEKFYTGSLLTIKQINDDPKRDGFVLVKVTSPISELFISANGNYQRSIFFEDIFHLQNNEVTIKIPLKGEFENQLSIGFQSVFENSDFTETLDVELKTPERKLEWAVESFRSKIEPGSQQKWSFKLNALNTKTEAEVLASMYDSSLDQFSTKNWEHLKVSQDTYNYSNFKSNLNSSTINRTVEHLNDYYYDRIFEDEETRLNWFGFDFFNSRYGDSLGITIIDIKDKKIGSETIKGEPNAVMTVDEAVGAGNISTVVEADQVTFVKPVYMTTGQNTQNPEYYFRTKKLVFVPGKKIVSGLTSMSVGDATLYIIDGEIASEEIFKKINPDEMISIDFLMGENAKPIYGEKGKNGVIIITTKKSLEALTQVKARKNLSETAFFFPNLKTDPKGNLSFNFTSPEALTAWKLRLLAHNKDAVSGYLEKSVVTQKELMVLPNFPRFFREKDTIVISTKISNMTDAAKTGIAMLQFFDATTMKPIDEKMMNVNNIKNFTIDAFGNTTASWTISIPEGLQGVQYKILAKAGNFSDGEENILPVLTNNMLVIESIPIWVRENSKKEYTFENLKNNNSTTLINHQFTLEYTSNPTWIAIQSLPYLMEYEHECAEQTFARYYANTLASEIISSNPKIATVFENWRKNGKLNSKLEENEELKSLILAETPWLDDAKSEDEKKKSLALLFDLEKMKTSKEATFQKLKQKQKSSGGFTWFDGGEESEYITRHILAGLGHLTKLNKTKDDASKIDEIAETGIPFLDEKFLESYKTRIKNLKKTEKLIWINPNADLHALYARSFYLEKYPLLDTLKKVSKLCLETVKKDWLKYTLYEKGLAALTLNRFGEKESAKTIIESLKETSSTNEDWGMYWIANKSGWYWYEAPIETQALLIEAFAEVNNDTKSVDAMKVWLLKNKQTKNWPTTKSTTEAIYALLMQGTDWLSVKDNTVIKLGDEKIVTKKLAENEKEAETGYIKLNWKAEEIKKEMASVSIDNKSKVPGFGGIYWQYFEDLDKIKTNSGAVLSVSKELYLKTKTVKGEELQKITSKNPLKTGDLVTVRLIITSKEDTEYVHLKDMRASCFEPVNVLSEYKYKDRLGFYLSTKDAATHLFFDYINKGTYVIEYDIRVNNSGEFSNGITTIESMYAPEFTSHTKGIRVKVN